jgi:DNA polymerase III catalytic subunit, dnaE type
MARNTNTSITKGVLKSLIYSGVLDIFPGTRKDKIESLDKVSKVIALLKKEQDTIFDKEEDIFNKFLDYKDSEFSNLEILLKEKEYTGYFISGHPVDKYNDLKNKLNNYNEIINIKDLVDGTDVDIIGIINKTRKILTRHGDLMSFANLSDVSGDIDTVIFPNTFSIFNRYLKESKIIVISGKVDKGKIIVQTIRNPEDITISTKIDHIQLDLSSFNNIKAKENLEQCILETTNLTPESIKMSYIFNETEYFGTKKYGYLYVDFNNVNIKKIKEIIGKENLKIIWKTDISI